jgi:CubicO group peptidase (beta-lactamase class C family)
MRSPLPGWIALSALAAAGAGAVRGAEDSAASAGVASHPRVVEALALLEVWADAERAYRDIPAVSMALVNGDDVFWSRGFGLAHRETRVAAAPDTLYSICSISKLFTALGVMQLRDQGRLELDEPIGSYLSWFDLQQAHEESPPITLRAILTHSSGLPRESAHPYWTGPDFPFPTREAVIEELSEQATLYPAERYFQYSNLGITLAGEVVAARSGEPYGAYVEKNILDPLGLRDTTPFLPAEERGKRLATGYGRRRREGAREPLPFFQTNGIAPAAGFASTALDLGRFAAWQLGLLEKGGAQVLKASTLREMHRVHWMDPDWKTTWGLGFSIARHGEATLVGHGGSCPGYRTELSIAPADRFAVAFLSNAIDAETNVFTRAAYDLVVPALKTARAELEEDGAAGGEPGSDGEERASGAGSAGTEAAAAFDASLYTGIYASVWGEAAIVRWDGGLAVVPLPTDAPRRRLETLKHVDGHTFRRVRDDGELGETMTFELEDGRVVRARRHGNAMEKVQ